ncbi:MAG TPA: hypothetical protein VFZ59_20110 [Verrucomicrobiae bacterium]|nr:hypothetical protein [Verrucomicrobiae bacterium]
MKTTALFSSIVLATASLIAADTPKDEVLAAAKKLGDKPNYAWKTITVVPEDAQFKPGPSEGKTSKDGITYVTWSFGDNTTRIYLKGDKAVADPNGDWQTLADLEGDEGPGRFLGFIIRNFKAPVAQAEELASAAKELKKEGDAIASEMTEEGAKKQFRWGNVTNPKGSVKFWLKEGQLAKLQFKLTGKIDFNGNEIDVDRDTTIEIKDVGTTKVEIPEAAMKKLNPPTPPTAK